ncbi:hypothetical protein AB205_0154030, partial [Aquarana catesbeiana]
SFPAGLFHALHWYNHIKSCGKQKVSSPGARKPLGKYSPGNIKGTTDRGHLRRLRKMMMMTLTCLVEVTEKAKRIREEQLAQYKSKKSKKSALIAKSLFLLDVKPWDNETDLIKLGQCTQQTGHLRRLTEIMMKLTCLTKKMKRKAKRQRESERSAWHNTSLRNQKKPPIFLPA